MPVPKPKSSMEVVKSVDGSALEDKAGKQAVGKEPFVSYSRPADNPVQWIQLLHAFEQQDPGWPLLTTLKIQMQKCDKCSREFCSAINYRRHIRVHHRLKTLDRDSAKNRDLLAAYWDKLSVEEAMDIVSFNNVALEEVSGSSFVMALRAVIQKSSLSGLPQVYMRAGSALLDIIQAKPSRFPISSKELFSILDDASENTFLRGTAASMQKYVFDGEAGKSGLETKNLVASTSFLLEQKLVKAWLADKDAEALRCQKLLVEEEEAAQRRQAKLLERKRQKKLRQKEQRGKEQSIEEKLDAEETVTAMTERNEVTESAGTLASSDSDAQELDIIPAEDSFSLKVLKVNSSTEEVSNENGTGLSNHTCNESQQGNEGRGGWRHTLSPRWQVPLKPQQSVLNGSHPTQSLHASKFGGLQKYGIVRDPRTMNANKVWSRKTRLENDAGERLKFSTAEETIRQPAESKNQVIIGSISVTLGNCRSQEDYGMPKDQNDCTADHEVIKRNNLQERPSKPEQIHSGTNRAIVKFWRPVSRNGNKAAKPYEKNTTTSEMDAISAKREDSNANPAFCEDDRESSHLAENMHPGTLQFNSQDAKAFLTQRWKEAMAAEHVTLVLCPEAKNDHQAVVTHPSGAPKRNILGNAENRLVGLSVSLPDVKLKHRMKPEMKKGMKIKYVPKHSTVT